MDADGIVGAQELTAVVTFDDLFRSTFPQVARTASLVARDRGIGPDIAQEAFARLFERWDRMASPDHARNFAFRVAVNLARSQLRRRTAAPFGLAGPERPVDAGTDRSDDWLSVAASLESLSRRQRAVVVMIDYADMDAATAARILRIRESTIRVHLMRGRRALRESLGLLAEEELR